MEVEKHMHFLEDYLQENASTWDVIYIMSSTQHLNHSFENIPQRIADNSSHNLYARTSISDALPRVHYGTLDINLYQQIEDSQAKIIASRGIANSPRVLIVMDDMVGVLEHKHKQGEIDPLMYISSSFTRMRHFNISCILLVQIIAYTLTKTMKSNADYILFSKLNEDAIKSASEATLVKRKALDDMLRQIEQYEFLCIDNKNLSNPIKILKSNASAAALHTLAKPMRAKRTGRLGLASIGLANAV